MTDTETKEMSDLARSVGDNLEAEANFDPSEWEPGDDIPGSIQDYLPSEWDTMEDDERPDALRAAFESWEESANDDALDIRAEVSLGYGDITVNDVTIVLGTGGPHVEVTLDADGRGHVTAYGWFMAGLTKYPISIQGHPLMSIVDYTIGELERAR